MTETFSLLLPDDLDARTGEVLKKACARDVAIATAESCTGGLIASLLTDVEGCSHAFEAGFVVYTDAAKTSMLGVPEDLLAAHGAVSEPVARAMAEGALARSAADIAVSVTGYAGPGGPGSEPGLVHFAIAEHGAPTRHVVRRYGDVGRGGVRLACVRTILDLLDERLS